MLKAENIPVEFPEDVVRQLKGLKSSVTAGEMDGRRDLRGLLTVTIDGEDAKDLTTL